MGVDTEVREEKPYFGNVAVDIAVRRQGIGQKLVKIGMKVLAFVCLCFCLFIYSCSVKTPIPIMVCSLLRANGKMIVSSSLWTVITVPLEKCMKKWDFRYLLFH